MAFPTVAATNTGSGDGTASTSHTVNLPASISAGDLLLIFLNYRADPGTISAAGWTFLSTDANGTAAFLALGYKTASGGEGATVTVSTVNSVKQASTSYRITGWQGTPEKGTAATGNNTTADPPSLSPSWGSADTLFIAAGGSGVSGGYTVAPTNYSNLLANAASGANAGCIGTAERQLTASSDDPGTFTQANGNWVAQTFAIQPAGAAATAKRLALLGVG